MMTAAANLRRRLPASLHRPGVLGIVLTPTGQLVLVRHTYISGWHPPGGGRKRGETPEAAVLRELEEEIGLEWWSSVLALTEPKADVDIFVVRDAVYRPRWSIEIETVKEFDIGDLPSDASPRLCRVLSGLDSLVP